MNYDLATHTFDGEPTLNDTQVLDFCRDGYLMLPGVVPNEINQRSRDYLDGKIPSNPSTIPAGMTAEDIERIRASREPSTIFLEDWYMEHVLLNPELCGVMRSLLGKNVGLPVLASRHTSDKPQPAGAHINDEGWHQDSYRVFGPELEFVEVFYFPQDTPAELGPTELVPSSHFKMHNRSREGGLKGVLAEGPAGTLCLHHQSILHRRGEATAPGIRHLLKYNYWRTVPPERDWIVEPDFDFHTANYGNEPHYAAHMFYWLCGKGDEYRIIGGQGWPSRNENQIRPSWGFGRTEGYLPDWRGFSAVPYDK